MQEHTAQDAAEFGVHVKQGGWRLGLLVARNVEKGSRGGDTSIVQSNNGKVAAHVFAKQAATTHQRVLRHLEAWERAADAGHVPHADDLTPGQEIDLDVETLPDWRTFYSATSADYEHATEERRKRWDEAEAETGVKAAAIARVAGQKSALGAAIKADPDVRKAVAEAITSDEEVASSFASDPGFRGAMAKATGDVDSGSRERNRPVREPADDTAAWTRLAQRFARFRRDVQSDLDHVNPDHLSEDVRTILREEARRTIVACEMVAAALDTGDWDQALTHLVEGGQA